MRSTKVNINWRHISIFLFVIFLWGLCWFLVTYFFSSNSNEDWAHRGQYGDMFGSVNALFSGLAFAGIIITILLQSEELALQRAELTATRKEFSIQNSTLSTQRFENTFFNLITLHNLVLDGSSYTKLWGDGKSTNYKGRDVFTFVIFELAQKIGSKEFEPSLRKDFESIFMEETRLLDGLLLLYMESIQRMVRFVAQSDLILPANKEFYYSIIASSLSSQEKVYLIYEISLHDRPYDVITKMLEIEQQSGFYSKLTNLVFHDSHLTMIDEWRTNIKKN
jgi:hypothetical protein